MSLCDSMKRRDLRTIKSRVCPDASDWGGWGSEISWVHMASYWCNPYFVYRYPYTCIYSTLRLKSWSAGEKDQDWAISAIHSHVRALGIYAGSWKAMFAVSMWPDVYVHYVYEYVHIYQEYMSSLVSGGTWGNRDLASVGLPDQSTDSNFRLNMWFILDYNRNHSFSHR